VHAPVPARVVRAPALGAAVNHLFAVMSIFNRQQTRTDVNRFFKVEPGLHHYVRGTPPNQKRLHLRTEADGSGVLVINASQIVHLNPSATLMAHLLLEEVDDSGAVKIIRSAYNVGQKRTVRDYQEFKNTFLRLVSPSEDFCPVCDLNLDSFQPFSCQPSAPYRMDLALTYRCNNRCGHCYNQASRCREELSLESWLKVLDHIWNLGIPHVVFTGGEPTLVTDLTKLIIHAEGLGLITGLNTNGRLLSEQAFVDKLVDAGLDHVQITLESHNPAIHDRIVGHSGAHAETVAGIRNVLKTHLYMMTNTTLLRSNSAHLMETLKYMAALGVPTIGLNGLIHSGRGAAYPEGLSENELADLLQQAKVHAETSGQRLIWYTPTQYCRFNPLDSGLGVKGCTAALYNMCVEPDGGVLPCQSYYQPLGNILADSWDNIWNHDLAVTIRNRDYVPDGCRSCDLLDTCGGGCPLYVGSNQAVQPQPVYTLPF